MVTSVSSCVTPITATTISVKGNQWRYWLVLGRRCFLPQAPRSYPIPMTHRVTPGHPEVTPGTKSYWHTSTTPPLVWQTKYVKCVCAIATRIFNTISFGDKNKLKVGNRHWHTRIDSKTAAFHPNEKSNQFCSTRPILLSWLWTWIRLISVRAPAWSCAIYKNLRQYGPFADPAPMCAFPHRHTTIWHKILSSALVTTSIQ